jgi:NAD(P)-dependent dehydrogenase (short-subunit alcohol dehydrogenase family)
MPIALVTGPNSGIGRETALQLAALGFHVVGAGRSEPRVRAVVDEIAGNGGSAEYLHLDLASLESVRVAAAEFAASGRRLDLLVNSAGIGVNRRTKTVEGFEPHFGINHLGHFALTHHLIPVLGPGSRVVSIASAVHQRARGIDFDALHRNSRPIGYGDYAVSKLANILFVAEFARRHSEPHAYAVHPGFVDTPLIPWFVRPWVKASLIPPSLGADTGVWCGTAEEPGGDSGLYYQRRQVTTPSAPAQDLDLSRELWDRSLSWIE